MLCGRSLAANVELGGALESRAYCVHRRESLADVSSILAGDGASVALLAIDGTNQAKAIRFIGSLQSNRRRRLIVTVSSLASARRCIHAGIGDFIKMPIHIPELLLRVELRMRDLAVRSGHLFTDLAAEEHMHQGKMQIGCGPTAVHLTDRECLLYSLFLERFGTPVSRGEILTCIWDRGPGSEATSNIVDVYVRYLRVKLAQGAPSLTITTVRGVGYVLEQRT